MSGGIVVNTMYMYICQNKGLPVVHVVPHSHNPHTVHVHVV